MKWLTWGKSTVLKQTQQVVVLSVNITTDLHDSISLEKQSCFRRTRQHTLIGASNSNRIGCCMKTSRERMHSPRISASVCKHRVCLTSLHCRVLEIVKTEDTAKGQDSSIRAITRLTMQQTCICIHVCANFLQFAHNSQPTSQPHSLRWRRFSRTTAALTKFTCLPGRAPLTSRSLSIMALTERCFICEYNIVICTIGSSYHPSQSQLLPQPFWHVKRWYVQHK